MTTTITLTLPSHTVDQARHALERYARLMDQHAAAIDARDWSRQGEIYTVMQDIADDLIEDAVLRGAWRVGEEQTA